MDSRNDLHPKFFLENRSGLTPEVIQDIEAIVSVPSDLDILLTILHDYVQKYKTARNEDNLFKIIRSSNAGGISTYRISFFNLSKYPEIDSIVEMKNQMDLSDVLFNIRNKEGQAFISLTLVVVVGEDNVAMPATAGYNFVHWRRVFFVEKIAKHIQSIQPDKRPPRFDLHVPVLSHVVYIVYNYAEHMRKITTNLLINQTDSTYILKFINVEEISLSFMAYIAAGVRQKNEAENLFSRELDLEVKSKNFFIDGTNANLGYLELSITIKFQQS